MAKVAPFADCVDVHAKLMLAAVKLVEAEDQLKAILNDPSLTAVLQVHELLNSQDIVRRLAENRELVIDTMYDVKKRLGKRRVKVTT